MSQTLTSQTGQTNLLATFFIRDTHCAMDAAGVQEVIRLGPLTAVPHAPPEVRGIINLRGRIVTVLDAGLKLGFARLVPDSESRVFIIEDHNEFIGLVVDRVGEVVEIEGERLAPAPANVTQAQSRFFKGVYRAEGKIITLVDVHQLLADNAQ
jgi:purine-binding chemotaxis protein CheW